MYNWTQESKGNFQGPKKEKGIENLSGDYITL